MLTALSPAILGREVDAHPAGGRRVPNPRRQTDPAAPKTIVGYYAAGRRVPVPTY